MSVKLSAYVWDGCAQSGMKLSEVVIMARLADWCNDEGVCWPSVETIARQIGAGESTVRNAIGKLVKAGWLSRRQRRLGNRNASNVYQLNVAKLREAASQVHPPESDTSKSEASKFEGTKSDPSKSMREKGFDPLKSGGDPLVSSKEDPSDKKTSCQPAAQTDPEVILTDMAKQVLAHLNQVTGSRYQVSKSSMENIRARLGEGFTTDELILTTDYLNAKWANDLKMAEFLRPVTLFKPSKFQGYLTGANSWLKAGRPECVNGEWVKANGEIIGSKREDHTERDAAYRRFIGSGMPLKNPSDLEQIVKAEASKAGVRTMNASFAVSRWNSIWKDCAQRTSGSNAA